MPVMPFESTRRARCATTQSGCTSTYEDEAQDRGVLLITFTFCAAPIARILAGFWRDPHDLSQTPSFAFINAKPAFRSSRRVHLLPQTHGARCRLLRVGRGNISACGQAIGCSADECPHVPNLHRYGSPSTRCWQLRSVRTGGNREPEALPASANRRLREAIVKVGPALAVPSEPAGTEQPRLGPTLGTLAGSMPVEVLWLAVAFVAIFERLDG